MPLLLFAGDLRTPRKDLGTVLAAAIRQLTAGPDALRRMDQAGRAALLGQGWDAMRERYLQLYRRLARRPAAAGVPDIDMTLKGESR